MLTFPFTATSVANFQVCSFPARSTRTVANLYTRITGIADFDVDPDWTTPDGTAEGGWFRGKLTIYTRETPTPQPVLQPGDVLVESAVTAGFRQIVRDESDSVGGGFDDFGLALDSPDAVLTSEYGAGTPFGNLTITLNAGYRGDIWMKDISFTADLLIYRPSLDNVGLPLSSSMSRLRELASDISIFVGP